MNSNIIVGSELERICDLPLGELLLRLLKTHEDNIIQVDAETGEEVPASLLLKRSIKLAKWLNEIGIKIGDRISINSENRLEYSVVTVASLFLGATIAPLNPDYTPLELRHVLSLSNPKIIFCSKKTSEKMLSMLTEKTYIVKLVLFDKEFFDHPNLIQYSELVKAAETEDIDEYQTVPLNPEEVIATILCSSGTTGMPKGVMCSQGNINAYIDISRTVMGEIAESEDVNDPMLGLMPFFHSLGFMIMFLNVLRGKKMVILQKFKPEIFLRTIVKYKITRLIIPPSLLVFLVKSSLVEKYDLSCIKEVRCGGAPMGKEIEREIKTKYKINDVSQAYGMTETTLGVLITPPGKSKIGSCGKVVPGMLAKIVNEQNVPQGSYKNGEICFKGPLIMKGYVGDPKSTSGAIDGDGWLHTGDIGYYDNEGYFFVVDRIKELIKYKGFQVAPAELEALLVTHPAIHDAAVIGLADEEAGELPLAFVAKKPGKDITESEVEKFVEDNLSVQKRLRGGVIFINEIPRTSTGKILRRILKEKAIHFKAKL